VKVADSDDVTGSSDEDTQALSITITTGSSGGEDLAITSQPTTTSTQVGHPLTFTVTAPGATTYQWRKNNVAISGANSDTYTIASTTFSDTGTYDVIVSNGSESVTSVGALGMVRALPFDEQGWTVRTPSADSRVVYVSSSDGSDSNDGLSPATPKATIAAGNALIRDGYPDHLLLKRGDTFVSGVTATLGAWKNGRSPTEPVVVSYYGDSGPRPVVKVANKFLDHDGALRRYQAIIGLEIYKSTSDPDSPDFNGSTGVEGIRFVGGGSHLLVEDTLVRFTSAVVETFGANPRYQHVEFRRNIMLDSWANNSFVGDYKAQGLFLSSIEDYIIEENFFDHNGWNETVPNAGANMYNHNIYIQYSNGPGGVVVGNILARASSHGLQARSGGHVARNLFLMNAIGSNMGGIASPTYAEVQTYPNILLDNVVLSGRTMHPTDHQEPRTAAIYGLEPIVSLIPNIRLEGNIVANRIGNGTNRAYVDTNMATNISYKWDASLDTSDDSWTRPDDDAGDYFVSIGGVDSTIEYLKHLRTRPVRHLPWSMTAYAPINYIREGFNRAPVSGHYTYDGLSDDDVAPAIVTEVLPTAQPDVPYSVSLIAIGGNGTLTWTQTAGSLPPGLSLSPLGVISGTATAEGNYTFTVQVSDADDNTSASDADVVEFTLTVAYPPNSVPEVTSTTVRASFVNEAYSFTLQGSGGEGGLVWSLASGALPPGITFSSTGVLSGTPTALGSYSFTVRVADSDEFTGPEDEGERQLVFNVYAPSEIIAPATNTFIHRPFAEQDGVFTAMFDVKPSTAPLSGNIGLSQGEPNGYGGMAVIIGLDSAGHFVARNGGVYTNSATILYQAGVTYRFRFEIDIPNHRYSVYVKPEGGAEQLLGANYAFRTEQNTVTKLNTLTAITASPAGSWVEITNFTIVLPGSAPEITTTALPSGSVGVDYYRTLEATGGDGALVWSLAGGSLPAGLNLSSSGIISGTPTAVGTSSFTVRVADSDENVDVSDEDTAAFTIVTSTPNLLDYALGVSTPNGSLLHRPVVTHANGRATIAFNRAHAEITYAVEASSDLETWTVVATNPGNVGELVSVEDTGGANAPRRFLRLAVTFDGQTQRSQPEGYVAIQMPAGSSTHYYSHPLQSPAIYRGRVTSVTADQITVAGDPFDAGAFAASPNWLRVLEGAQAGRHSLITSNGTNTVTVDLQDGTGQSVALTASWWNVAVGDLVEIAPADTLDSLFGDVVNPGSSIFTADTVSLWDGTRWVAYHRSTTHNVWLGQTTGLTPQDDLVIAPHQAWGLTRRPVRPAATLVLPGAVPESRQLLRHFGVSTVYTGVRFPVTQRLEDFAFEGPGSWTSHNNVFAADTVSLWDGTTWVSYWRTPAGVWRRQGDATEADQSAREIEPGHAVSILRRSAATGVNVFISQPQPYSDPRQ
jgi:hypothetical protein